MGGGRTLRTAVGSLLLCLVTDEPYEAMEGLLMDLLLDSTGGRLDFVAFETCCWFNAAILADREVN